MPSNPDAGGTSRLQRWKRTTFSPFEHSVFALFWWASLVSSFGSMIQTTAASWLMAIIAPSPDKVALVQTASAMPFFLLALIAGALADTRDRRTIMLLSQILTLAASVALAAVVLSGRITPALLLGFTFLIGCGAALFLPAWQSSIGDLVPPDHIAPAVAANAVGINLARSFGPAIGGVLVAITGAASAFVVNAASNLGIIATLVWWRPTRVRSELPPEPLVTALGAGLRYVRLSPHLVAILLRVSLHAIPTAAVLALMPVVARDLVGGGATTYGLLLAGFGIGAMIGALSSATLRARFNSDAVLRVLAALGFAAMIGISQSRWAGLTLLAHVLSGVVWALAFANFNIAIQLSSPRWVTGRMLATYHSVTFASVALGSWWWGELATAVGVREALAAAAGTLLISLLVARWLPVTVAQLGSLNPRDQIALTPPAVDIHSASGPIIVIIEYRVKPEHAVEFAAVINEIGRIRRRDGARDWSVCQDVDAIDLWMERFETPTWLDYLRLRLRPTQSDQVVRERLARLVDGEQGRIRRLLFRPPNARPLGAPSNVDNQAHGIERTDDTPW